MWKYYSGFIYLPFYFCRYIYFLHFHYISSHFDPACMLSICYFIKLGTCRSTNLCRTELVDQKIRKKSQYHVSIFILNAAPKILQKIIKTHSGIWIAISYLKLCQIEKKVTEINIFLFIIPLEVIIILKAE